MLIEIWLSLIAICVVVSWIADTVYDSDITAAVSCGILTLLLFGPSAILFFAAWALPGDGVLFLSVVGFILSYGSGYWMWTHIRDTIRFIRWQNKRSDLLEGRTFPTNDR